MTHSRRDFLKRSTLLNAGFFFSPIDFLTENLCPQFLCKDQGIHHFVLFHLAGAPARWLYDSPLRPKESMKMQANPMVTTSFSDKEFKTSRDIELEYKTTKVKDYLMPIFWDLEKDPILKSKGKLNSLLDHALIIRGTRMGIDGHSINSKKIALPNPNFPSITGLVGDKSQLGIPSVGMKGSYYPTHVTPLGAYKSGKASPLIILDTVDSDPFNTLFENFLHSGTKGSTQKDEMIEQILSKSPHLGKGTKEKRAQARQILDKNLNLLKEQYFEIFEKYQNIIKVTSRKLGLKGITDKRIPGFEKERIRDKNFDNLSYFLNEDFILSDFDLRDSLKTLELRGLAQQFTLTEFLLVNRLSSSLTIEVPNPTALDLKTGIQTSYINFDKKTFNEKAKIDSNLNQGSKTFKFDSHGSGLIPHHLYNSMFFYTFTHCLLELTETLQKTKGLDRDLYSETLIHIASEFEREPRPDQLGSEHGFNGQVNTFLSGSIEDFKIIGNIFDTNRGETEATFRNIGTWGEGAPLRHLNGRPLVYGNIASSICQVMGVESPTPKDHSLLKVWNGKIRTHTDELENIIS